MTKLFITEKPSQAKCIGMALAEENDVAIVAPTITGYWFDYPSYLTYKNYPYSNEYPNYKINTDCLMFSTPLYKMTKDGELKKFQQENILNLLKYLKEDYSNEIIKRERQKIIDYFNQFEEIIIATDSDYTGTRTFDLYIFKFLDAFYDDLKIKITRTFYGSMDEESLKNHFENRESIKDSKLHEILQRDYKNKDFFAYNFNINSLMIFNDILKKVGCCRSDTLITFNMLMILTYIKEEKLLNDLFIDLSKNEVGTQASRYEIIEQLIKYQLIEKTKKGSKNNKEVIRLTKIGYQFLDLIHDKIKLFDPLEIFNDRESLEASDFQEKYSEKLNIYFKKQRSYFRNRTEY